MKMLIGFFFSLLLAFTAAIPAYSASNVDVLGAEFALNKGGGIQKYQLGTIVTRESTRNFKAQYSFAGQGGAIGAHNMWTPYSHAPLLPQNAIITGCFIEVITAPVGASATIALSSGKTAADLLAATAITSFTAGSILACIPVGTAATAIKMTADVTPTMTIATTALTAGVFNVNIQYVVGGPN